MTQDRTSAMERLLAVPTAEESPVKELFSVDGTLKMKSEIPPGLILHLARAYTIADLTKSKILLRFCDNVLQLQISKDRKGRVEMMESIIARIRRSEEEE